MIGVNPLRTKVLITTDEVIFHATMDSKVDPRIILQSIIIAEVRFIKSFIGLAAYKTLVDAKNILVTNVNKAALEADINAGRSEDRELIVLVEGDYVNSDTYLTTDQQYLWNNYLHKLTAECVYMTALVPNRARFNSKGVIKNSPNTIGNQGESATVDLYELKHLMDRTMQQRIAPLMDDAHTYLCSVKYPGYTRKCDCDMINTVGKYAGISLNMYDEDETIVRNPKRGCGW